MYGTVTQLNLLYTIHVSSNVKLDHNLCVTKKKKLKVHTKNVKCSKNLRAREFFNPYIIRTY